MAQERLDQQPTNIVTLNKYLKDSRWRVGASLVREEWYTARLIDPESENINQYARDILMRVIRVKDLKSGARNIYAVPANIDGDEVDEEDAVPMNGDGYFVEAGAERGYLLDVFARTPNGLDSLAASASVDSRA